MSPALKSLLQKHSSFPLATDEEMEALLQVVCGMSDRHTAFVANLRQKGHFKSFSHSMTANLLSPAELPKYSLSRAIKSAADSALKNGAPMPGGFEGEVSQTLASSIPGRAAKGFIVPFQCLKTLNASAFGAGGALAGSTTMDPLAVLRNRSVVANAGAMLFEDVCGDLVFPRQKTGAVGQWLSEIGTIQDFDAEWDALVLKAHRIGGVVKFTRELLNQTGGAMEDWARRELLGALATALDAGALGGAGQREPLGLCNSDFVQTISFTDFTVSGAPTITAAAEMERLVSNANAPEEDICFISTPDVRKKWRLTQRTTGDSRGLWGDDNCILGRPAYATKNVPGDRMICGAFSHYSIAMFGAVDILVNPFTRAQDGIVSVTLNAWADTGEFYPESFCVSTDAANQEAP